MSDFVTEFQRAVGAPTLGLDLTVPQGTCCCCRTESDVQHLSMEIVYDGDEYRLSLCRFCLSEHAPELLSAVESE